MEVLLQYTCKIILSKCVTVRVDINELADQLSH